MGLTTEPITYNVHERGRRHLGTDRRFDLRRLAGIINGPEVQERVKVGDMVGYYGHWPRIAFGMATREVGMMNGKPVPTPIALRTTLLRADDDGNITHQAQFLDNVWGKEAEGHYLGHVGGFSSAIDAKPGSTPHFAQAFHGLDYVLEPNYTTNRGHRALLDSVGSGEATDEQMLALLDAVTADAAAMVTAKNALLDSVMAQYHRALEALERATAENDVLVGRLASGQLLLDSVERQAPLRAEMPLDYGRFRGSKLAALQELPRESDTNSPEARALARHYGVRA